MRGPNSQLGISIAAIVVSFSLMAAMLIMIGSFRGSLEAWLEDILPADAYLRAGGAGQTGFLDAAALRGIATLPSVARTAAVRIQEVRMQPGQAPITLLARDIDPADPRALPQLQPGAVEPRGDLPPVWISEAAADLYGWRVGNEIGVALGGAAVRFGVAGIWRDYTRQNGTLLIDRARYVAATGDTRVNDVWVWLAPGGSVATLAAELRQAPGGAGLVDVRDAAGIRRVSLALFDRTFAVTYLLEAVAVLIGLFGISVGFSSQVLARRAEFGMLRHVGVTRRQIAALLGIEGLLAGATGIAVRAGHRRGDQPHPDPCRQPPVVSLEHGPARAGARAGGGQRRAGPGRNRHGGGQRPAGDERAADRGGEGRLVRGTCG
ncbi:MAG: ABC transporter permease [Betaproteobacteria bacterium]|nr:ABC transporter permease [Betaproteobacteria bacterium]